MRRQKEIKERFRDVIGGLREREREGYGIERRREI